MIWYTFHIEHKRTRNRYIYYSTRTGIYFYYLKSNRYIVSDIQLEKVKLEDIHKWEQEKEFPITYFR